MLDYVTIEDASEHGDPKEADRTDSYDRWLHYDDVTVEEASIAKVRFYAYIYQSQFIYIFIYISLLIYLLIHLFVPIYFSNFCCTFLSIHFYLIRCLLVC